MKDLDYPNIVKIFEFFEDSQFIYIVMEFIKGGSLLAGIIKQKRFSEETAATIVRQLLSTLNYCHMNEVVHRDVKPENIMLEEKSGYDMIKIIDFGSA